MDDGRINWGALPLFEATLTNGAVTMITHRSGDSAIPPKHLPPLDRTYPLESPTSDTACCFHKTDEEPVYVKDWFRLGEGPRKCFLDRKGKRLEELAKAAVDKYNNQTKQLLSLTAMPEGEFIDTRKRQGEEALEKARGARKTNKMVKIQPRRFVQCGSPGAKGPAALTDGV